jgi:hypothetical protein
MPASDDPRLARLTALLAAFAADDAAALIAEARDAAREEARSILQDAWREALLEAAAALVEPGPPERREAAERRIAPDDGTAWWVYCVVPAAEVERVPSDLRGVDAAGPVEVVARGDLAALVSAVPLSEYGDERLREHLEDLAWVERVARAHEEVLEATMAATTIVPLRLCTIYLTRDRVEALLDDQAHGLTAALAELRGRSEWGVKVFALPRAVTAAAPAGSAGGSAYLERKRGERTAREDAQRRATECAQQVHDRLSYEAVASRVNPPQRPEAHGRDAEMLLNGSYLFDDERRDALRSLVDVLAHEHAPLGFSIELTGPWPPYNFVASGAPAIA